ncbi:glutathione synthetase isoform X2 [Rhipicephalus sanguineus]|uniref:glutathione synthetase isoform X2 n=1 Tax=Rhipicephalus sanguineus TaxID=34632 RepID=UPI0020C58078|nr:glutathione synthetase isoform X2 [Rhipicephalus sanguineus]
MERLESCVAALQDENVLKRAVQDAKEYAISRGVCMKSKSREPDSYTFVPFCLLPSPYPREAFQQVKSLQEDINLLIHRVAHDYSFLRDCLQSTIETDEFTASIFNIYQKVWEAEFPQPLSLGLLRSDYMLDLKSGDTKELHKARPKQVEVNTIASSFGGITPPLCKLQKYIMRNLGVVATEAEMPKCRTDKLLGKGLLAGWKAYKNDNDGVEIAVVYYRTAYAPQQMNAQCWDTRLRIELSRAIKCPSVQYHLAGTKKVQQVLAQPDVLERFFTNKVIADSIRATFTGLYSLDLTPEGHKAAEEAIANPRNYVLKPQREGGGNNVYGDDVRNKLQALGRTKEREGYILMDLIQPPITTNYIVRLGDEVSKCNVVSELGIFGVILGDQYELIENYEAGHIVRTKMTGMSEGGICAGFASLDSVFLV